MTQQFKFGDRVRCKQTGAEGLIIDTGKTAAWIIWEGQKCSNFYAYDTFEAVPHPDTARLDWLAAQDDIDITLGNTVQLKPCLRAHIDAAMQEQSAAEAT